MITRLQLRNFRCFREADIELGPLTALVGPNAAGKSSLLTALDPNIQPTTRDAWRRDTTQEVRVEHRGSGGFHAVKSLTMGSSTGGPTPVVQHLQLDLGQLRAGNLLGMATRLGWSGDNVANLFASIGRQKQIALVEDLRELVPAFGDVDLQPMSGGYHQLRFYDRWDPSVEFTPAEVSDGSMLVLAYLLLRFQPETPDVVTIEEPERGLHPYLLHEMVAFLRRFAHGDAGRPGVQIIFATHSAEMLDALRPDEVRFLTRVPDDGTVRVTAPATDSPQWKEAYREYSESMGSLWLTGGLGGVPGT